MFRNYLKITWKVLQRKKVYTLVTLAGIVIPVTFIVLITSFLVQLNSYDAPKTNFKNVIYVDYVTWKQIKEDGKTNSRTTNPPTLNFVNKYIKTLKSPMAVSVISANVFFGGNDIIYLNNKANEVSIKYSDSELWRIADFRFINGRPFNKSEFDQSAQVAVIDKKTSNTFFGTTDAVGKVIRIKNKAYNVVGIVENVNITMSRLTANIYLPYSCNDNYHSKSQYSNFSSVIILSKNKENLKQIEREYQQKLKTVTFEDWGNFNHIEGELTRDTSVGRLKGIAKDSLNMPLYAPLIVLFLFFLVLPAINLVNININRVYERLSEIGVRKSFGATRMRLVHQFLFENLVLIFTGGILSLVVSLIIISVVNTTGVIPGIQLEMHFGAILISLISIFILGILSGLMPSMKMAKTTIVHSLSNSESK